LRFDFIRREKKAYPVTVLCKVMEVSRSGFYDYFDSLKGSDDPGEVALKARTAAIFKEHRGQYGSRRILKQLKTERLDTTDAPDMVAGGIRAAGSLIR